MPNNFMNESLVDLILNRRDIGGFEQALYTHLRHYDRKPGEAWPSLQTLATDLGVNPRSIVKALANLEAEGLIEIQGSKICRALHAEPEFSGLILYTIP